MPWGALKLKHNPMMKSSYKMEFENPSQKSFKFKSKKQVIHGDFYTQKIKPSNDSNENNYWSMYNDTYIEHKSVEPTECLSQRKSMKLDLKFLNKTEY